MERKCAPMGAPAEIPADVARPARRTARRRSPSAPTGGLRRRSAMGTSACGTRSPARRSASRWEPRRKISKVLPRTSPSLPTPPCSPRPLSILTGARRAVAWRVSDGKELFTLNIDDGYGRGSAVAFTPDGKLLATGGGTGEIKLWDASTVSSQGRRSRAPRGGVGARLRPDLGAARQHGPMATRLWDLERRAPFGSPPPASAARTTSSRT